MKQPPIVSRGSKTAAARLLKSFSFLTKLSLDTVAILILVDNFDLSQGF